MGRRLRHRRRRLGYKPHLWRRPGLLNLRLRVGRLLLVLSKQGATLLTNGPSLWRHGNLSLLRGCTRIRPLLDNDGVLLLLLLWLLDGELGQLGRRELPQRARRDAD